MGRNRLHVLLLILPLAFGIAGGFLVGDFLYERSVREIESRYRRPARELITDLADVWFGYTALSVLAGTLLGLLAGVFGYAFFKNRDAEPHHTFSIKPHDELDGGEGSVRRIS